MASCAALFDLDGTLVDNMGFHSQAWVALCARHGLSIPAVRFEREFAGKKSEEILPELFGPSLPVEQRTALAAQKEAEYRSLFGPHLALMPGARELLEQLRARGIPRAIASAAPPENRAFVLEGLGLSSLFDAVVGAEKGLRGKPFPDLFLAAAAAVGVRPECCVAFEDAVHGITAAKAAGMWTVGLPTTVPAELLRQAGADLVIADFRDPPPELRARLFGD